MSPEEQEAFREKYADVLTNAVFVATDNVDVLLTEEAASETIKSSFRASLVATDDPRISEVIGLYEEGSTLATDGRPGASASGASGSGGSSDPADPGNDGSTQATLPYPGAGEAVISNKMADELGLHVGDTVRFIKSGSESGSESGQNFISLRVSGIFENYISNYIFITGETYAESFGVEPAYKNAYTVLAEGDEQAAFTRLASDSEISRIVMLGEIRNTVDRMMQGLNSIIWLIIALALSLAFVVVYNISNINITERNRELATIKVLGFYDAESYLYIFRENIVLTVFGALFGLLLGKGLHSFVMNEINVEAVSFKTQILPQSYLLSFALTLLITLVVSLLLTRKVKNVNMAESLKSAE